MATPPHHSHGPHHQRQHHNNMSQSYHPHSIFYGQQYHRIQPQQQQTFCHQQMAPLPPQPPPPLRLTDSFEQLSVLQRHSGSSFRSSNTSSQSPPNSVLMTDSTISVLPDTTTGICENTNLPVSENPYECIPAQFKNTHIQHQTSDQAEAVTRFDSN